MVKRAFDDIFGSGSAKISALFESKKVCPPAPDASADTPAAGAKTKKQKRQAQQKPQSTPETSKKANAEPSEQPRQNAAEAQQPLKHDLKAAKPTADARLKTPRAKKPAKISQQKSSDIVTIQPTNALTHKAAGGQTNVEEAALAQEAASSPAQKDERLDRTIFVGNIQADTKPKVLKQIFARYGTIDSVRMRSIPVKLDAAMPRRAAVLTGKVDAQRATAHAYVVFSQPHEATAALAHNMHLLEGLHMCVNAATGPGGGTASAGSYNKSRSIFVGNLNFAAQDEDLIKLFNDGSRDPQLQDAVTAVRVVRDSKTNIGKGIAFVEFNSKGAAAAAMRLKDLKLDGRPLRISFLKTPKAGAAAPAHHAKTPGSNLAKNRIQKREQTIPDGKKKPWAGTKAKKITKPGKR